ncbi:MAG: acetyl-CoA decarbonylase/synthase complex subunit gamma, partial [Promethearchaeota archaeon]
SQKPRAGPMDIYPLLPQTNCKECGEANCMAYATKLAEYTIELSACKPLFGEAKYSEKLAKLKELMRPPVKEVIIGIGDHQVKIGGELVLFRHDLRYIHPPAFFIDVPDTASSKAIEKRVKEIEEWTYIYIGMNLRLNGIALRCVSGDPATFAKAAEKLGKITEWPIILCSLNPKVLAAGLEVLGSKRPLIYAATKETWKELGNLAIKHKCPLAIYSPGNLDDLKSLATTVDQMGVDVVLDPGNEFGAALGATVDDFSMLRRTAIRERDLEVGFPLMATPISVWGDYKEGEAPELAKWQETLAAAALITRYADIIVFHSLDMWVQLPLTFLRTNLYTDPVKPVAVEPGLREMGSPDSDSPVMYTSNFALTYFTVESDIKQAGIDCWLIVVDTEGLSIQSAVAGRKLTADTIAEAIKEYKVEEKVSHRILISPGMAARLSGETEEASGWTVKVGPKDSSGIPQYIRDGLWKEK